jgi:hypothetical protein
VTICQLEYREDLSIGKLSAVVKQLVSDKACPAVLATPVVIYAVKQGIYEFCEPLNLKL